MKPEPQTRNMQPDPRTGMGFIVEDIVVGPYRVVVGKAHSPDQGGKLDRAILAHTLDGRPVVIGEIWAMGFGEDRTDIRLHASAIADHIIQALDYYEEHLKPVPKDMEG